MIAIDRSLLPVGVAVLIAVTLPTLLLWPRLPAVDAPAPIQATSLKSAEVGSLEAVLKHPLFADDRAPPPSPEMLAAANAPPVVLTPPPQLVGTISGRGGGIALIKPASGDTVTLSIGMSTDSWRLIAVGNGSAVVEQAGRRETIVLNFKNKLSPDRAASAGQATNLSAAIPTPPDDDGGIRSADTNIPPQGLPQ
jgi:hypothetical protein